MNYCKNIILAEVSWEVCNKVGGIHTVISSKSNYISNLVKEHNLKEYFLIGPYFKNKKYLDFKEEKPNWINFINEKLKKEGLFLHYGTWDIKGSPKVMLLDFSNYIYNKNNIKKRLWERYGIDSLFSSWDFEEPIVWSWGVGRLIEEIIHNCNNKDDFNKSNGENINHTNKIILHLHEWLSAGVLFYLKDLELKNKNISKSYFSIFTTHATILGRSLASNDTNYYRYLNKDIYCDFDKKAYELNIQDKHLTEKAVANNVDILTTVSHLTGKELEVILGRKPDKILFNGLDFSKFYSFKEIIDKHNKNNLILKEFLTYYLLPFYNIDTDKTIFLYTMGRSEFRNKGIDLFIKSLGLLNKDLVTENYDKNVFVFFFIPYYNHGKDKIIEEKKSIYKDLKSKFNSKFFSFEYNLINIILKNKENFDLNDVIKENFEFFEEIKDRISSFYINHNIRIPLSTHLLPETNEIITEFKKNGLDNRGENKVKVVLLPEYLEGLDGFLNLNIYNAVLGCDLGVFPSFYEPWGYTPLESAALGVPSITTNLSGFGQFILELKSNDINSCNDDIDGIFVLNRNSNNDNEEIINLKEIIKRYIYLNFNDRLKEKIKAYEMASNADWRKFIKNYEEIYLKAMNNLK